MDKQQNSDDSSHGSLGEEVPDLGAPSDAVKIPEERKNPEEDPVLEDLRSAQLEKAIGFLDIPVLDFDPS